MAIDYELSASPYILDGKYQKAVELLQQAYNRSFNEDILIKITTIYTRFSKKTSRGLKKGLEEYRGKTLGLVPSLKRFGYFRLIRKLLLPKPEGIIKTF